MVSWIDNHREHIKGSMRIVEKILVCSLAIHRPIINQSIP
jgi:hypothetical protein